MRTLNTILWLWFGFIFVGLGLGGCARTHAWQRETLARPSMHPDGDRERAALKRHILGIREGAVGGLGGGGGGCGCN